jgi:hypothetical protein
MGDDAVTAILERLHHACGDHASGFWFMRAILKVMSDRMRAIRAQLVDAYSPMAAAQ